jgi:hypothetical protein
MKTKKREYLARAKQCEERAKKVRDPEGREWQTTLARAYKMLAEATRDAEQIFDIEARQRTGQIIGRTRRC